MKPNRVHHNGGKVRRSAQSAKSTKTASEKPATPPAANPDIEKLLEEAILEILNINTSEHGLTAEIISKFLPKFGFTSTPDQALIALAKLAQAGTVAHKGEFWHVEQKPSTLSAEAREDWRETLDNLDNGICRARALVALLLHRLAFPGDWGDFDALTIAGIDQLSNETFSGLKTTQDDLAYLLKHT